MDNDARVTSKGQVTIPRAIREALGIKPGDRVRFRRGRTGKIEFTKRTNEDPLAKWVGFITDAGSDVDKLMEEMRGR